jgi:cellulose synthase/poly-beta-1,6-N-acetylglucosamine synthase-like glycosyltransferase
MRQVRFALRDRLTLIPVELVHVLLPTLAGAAAAFLIGGPWAAMAVLAAVLAGVVLFPILLPWIPTREFSTKGFILGAAVALPFAAEAMFGESGTVWWLRVGLALAYLLTVPPVTAFLALNFTGSTTFTSRTGVRREIFAYVPVMAWMFGIGAALTIVLIVIGMVGGSQ